MGNAVAQHPPVSPVKPSPLLVAIVGGSGAGKSWLAKRLQAALDPDAVHFSLDDFYHDRSHLDPERRAEMNFDNPRAIDWLTVEKALNDLRNGRQTLLPRYNFKTHCRSAEVNTLVPKPVVIMDGLWLLRRSSVRSVFGLKIFIECPARTRRSRRLTRDLRSRGRTRASVLDQLRKTVEPMYDRFVAPQRKWADIRLRHDISEREVRRLAHELRERLNRLHQSLRQTENETAKRRRHTADFCD